MTQNCNARSSNEPKGGRKGVCDDCKWDSQNDQSSVELCGSCTEEANIQITALKLADTVHATNDKKNDKCEQPVGEQRVDAQHDEQDGIVAGKVTKIVVDPVLDLAKVLRLGQSLEVEELANGLQVGKAALQVLRANTVKTTLQIEARCDGIERNVDASCHGLIGGCMKENQSWLLMFWWDF